MALLNFPPNPSIGDTYTIGINTWQWTGSAWIKYTSGPSSPISVNTQTNSTSTNTGAVVVEGGIGVSGSINIGSTSTINGAEILTTATINLQIVTDGGNTTTNPVLITNLTTADSTITGALIVDGGVGIGGNLYVGGEIVAQKLTIEFTTVTNISVETDDVITSTNATDATSTLTGALIIAGGAGIGGNLYVGGEIVAQKLTIEYTTVTTTLVQTDDIIQTLNETDSADTTTGALIVAGGAGIAKTLTLGYGLVLNPDGSITFGDGTVQTSRAFKFFTNADVALGLTTDDMLPGDWYFDDATESIYVMVNYGEYNQLQDLTVRPTI
jgi:hypothetical protein